MSAGELWVSEGNLLVCDGAVVVGECACARRVERLTIESLGPQDDDLMVQVGERIVSDTRLNVSAYYGETVSPGGVQGFNNAWTTQGFRKLVLENPGCEGERVKIYTCDVGGMCEQSLVQVTVLWKDGAVQEFTAGVQRAITPPAWPEGTLGDAGELVKTSAERPWNTPGSPPIWVPLAEWVLGKQTPPLMDGIHTPI